MRKYNKSLLLFMSNLKQKLFLHAFEKFFNNFIAEIVTYLEQCSLLTIYEIKLTFQTFQSSSNPNNKLMAAPHSHGLSSKQGFENTFP